MLACLKLLAASVAEELTCKTGSLWAKRGKCCISREAWDEGSANRQRSEASLPWVPEVFLERGIGRRPTHRSAVGRGHERRSAANGYRSFRYKFTQSSCKVIVPRTWLKEKRIPTQNVFLVQTVYEVKESFVQIHCLCSSWNDRFPCSQAILFGKLISGKCGHLPGSHLRQNDITFKLLCRIHCLCR